MSHDIAGTAEVLDALGHPFRLALVHAVSMGTPPVDLSQLAARWQVDAGDVQIHVKKLLDARVLRAASSSGGTGFHLVQGRLQEVISRLDRI